MVVLASDDDEDVEDEGAEYRGIQRRHRLGERRRGRRLLGVGGGMMMMIMMMEDGDCNFPQSNDLSV